MMNVFEDVYLSERYQGQIKQCDNDTVACTSFEKLQNNGFGFAAITTIHYQKSSNILYQRRHDSGDHEL